MIMPSKIIKPVDSLFCMSAYVIDALNQEEGKEFDELLDDLNQSYPKVISIEKLQQCLDFLLIINRLEVVGETDKIILR